MKSLTTCTKFDGLCHHLHTATLCTADLGSIKKFYVEAMSMSIEGPFLLSSAQKETQRNLWGIPEDIDYDYYRIHRSAVPSLIEIRLLHLHTATPHIHKSYSSRELGSFSLGFPNGDIHQMDERVAKGGFGQMASMQTGDVTRNGKTYPYYETIYKGPDFLHCVGLQRGNGMKQVSPIDHETNLGGPGYSAYVTDRSDEELDFYINVLDLEIRFDWVWEASPGSALGIDEGVPFRFVSLYAKGSHQNHLLFLDYQDGIFEENNAAPRIPNQGLGMWTFETKNIDAVVQNASTKNIESGSIQCYHDPILGECKCITMTSPTGFLVEVFELI